MINHASAFVLFVIGIILNEAVNYFTDDSLYYIDWFLTAVIGTASMFCLANILWHLGTKEDQVEIQVESFSTDLDA